MKDLLRLSPSDFVGFLRERKIHRFYLVHRTCRGQAAGGVRFWSYDAVEDYLG